ncbi:hypothetical protein KP509_26G034600 [Ceratopteris richardii]|uniref:Uncharacterized protein n=1 Tax=Ceratopteris richardii TaxID=49495 RepID=A0A8T2RLX3_CERRI|nr:hypothetical protein KP509_26G034600 [Ceratopteris richardii]
MGAWKRIRGKILSAKVMAWAGAINTVLSAVLYLGDFITTVLALRDYYHYQFLCPHLPPSSDVLRHDPVCRAVNVDPSLHNMGLLFWWCVGVLALGHLSYAIVFYCFCRRRIIRIALFMPLLQLYRLIRVLMRTCSTESLNELQRRQRRLQSLHTYLVVALESVPQFILQSLIVLDISQYIRGSNDPDLQPQQIPKTLVISIIFSFSSAIYNAAISMYLSMDSDHTSLSNRLCMSFMIGESFTNKLVMNLKHLRYLSEIVCTFFCCRFGNSCFYVRTWSVYWSIMAA